MMKLHPIPYQGGPLDGQLATPLAKNRFANYRDENGSTLYARTGDIQLLKMDRGERIEAHFYVLRSNEYLHTTRL
jgi:hypothetical protein